MLIQPGAFDSILGLTFLALDNNLPIEDDRQLLVNLGLDSFIFLNFLSLSNSNLTQMPVFNSSSSAGYTLYWLYLAGNRIKSIDSSHFRYLKQLNELDLANNQIEHVLDSIGSGGVFGDSGKLESLNLSSNLLDLNSINRINFNMYINLRLLNLSHNRIDVLCRYLFSGLNKLEQIDVSFNQIRLIEANTFNRLSSLKAIYLNGIMNGEKSNELVVIEEGFTIACESLKFVYVSSTDLVRTNAKALSKSLKAVATKRNVAEVLYFNSINLIVSNLFGNYDEANQKNKSTIACELTIFFLRHLIQVNLFDDFGFNVFMSNCYSLDIYMD